MFYGQSNVHMYVILTGCSEAVHPDPVVGNDTLCVYYICVRMPYGCIYVYMTYVCMYIYAHMNYVCIYYVHLVYRTSCTICYSLYFFMYGLI